MSEASPATKAIAIVATRMILSDALRDVGADNIMRYFETNFRDLPAGPDRDYLLQMLEMHRRLQSDVDQEDPE